MFLKYLNILQEHFVHVSYNQVGLKKIVSNQPFQFFVAL